MALDPADCIAIVIGIALFAVAALGIVGFVSHRKNNPELVTNDS